MTLNPLSNPKGVKLLCELCQKPAFVQCTRCRVTYYCGVEHQQADWLGIHEKICQLLIPLRTTQVSFLSSEEQRRKQEAEMLERREHMIELTRTTGQKLLFEGKHEQAVPAAMQSLRFSIDVHGLDSIELVPSYLILAEASIGLHKLQQAEEYLAQAQWTVVKTPDASHAMKSKLYRNWGLLYAAEGNYEEALRNLADDIFNASEQYGTDNIGTSGGYFHMANVFFRQNHMDIADSLYGRVTDIWHTHLLRLVRARTHRAETPAGVGAVAVELKKAKPESLDEAQEAEANQVLHSIHDIREQSNPQDPVTMALVCHALGMLYFLLEEYSRARDLTEKCQALMESSGEEDSELMGHVANFSQALRELPNQKEQGFLAGGY
ncbi:zinc finger MYND domain-containing protein 12-like [Strongylocentrotus purpuratus]|uniref:MYND-type domain-containing protein n=1 Tax=Strongylocentrotus purpuratus TaxID=7668 RepID=A0A7M7NGV6_STRPU|nr:zinc finger MYND domain-containing protein 12-like [Strongylocentrotus purpuratus]